MLSAGRGKNLRRGRIGEFREGGRGGGRWCFARPVLLLSGFLKIKRCVFEGVGGEGVVGGYEEAISSCVPGTT